MSNRVIGFLIAGGVVLFLLINSLFVVTQTEQALVLQFGEVKRVEKEPGLKFKTPFIQNVVFFDNRLLEFDAESKEINASDQKRVIIDAFIRYKIASPLRFYQTVQNERGARDRLNDILESSLKKVVGSHKLSDLLSPKRDEIMEAILQDVNHQTGQVKGTTDAANSGFGIDVVDVRIYGADLPETNSRAIYSRMETDRLREAKQFRAQGEEMAQGIKAKAERERTEIIAEAKKKAEIIRGEGDGKASRTYAAAYGRDAEFYRFYRSLQAYRTSLLKGNTTMVLSPDSEFLKYLDSSQ